MRYFFARLDEKHNLLENLRKFSKVFLRKLQKMHYLSIFFKKITNNELNFCAFGRKTQIAGRFWENSEIFWWNFYRKIEFFYFYFFNLLLKIEPSVITPFFYNNFFRFRGDFPPSPPAYALVWSYCKNEFLQIFSPYFSQQKIFKFIYFHLKIKNQEKYNKWIILSLLKTVMNINEIYE